MLVGPRAMFPPPFVEVVVNAAQAGDLAHEGCPLATANGQPPHSQLRDSTGLTPVSPLSLPIRGFKAPERHLFG